MDYDGTTFDAAETGRIILTWQTGTEVDNAGFNLHRAISANGRYTKINDHLIPAAGSSVSGAIYTYIDTNVTAGEIYYYQLEDIDIHGVSTFHDLTDAASDGAPVTAASENHRIYLPSLIK